LESKNASSAGDGIKGVLGDTLTLNNGEKYVIPGIKKVGNPPSTINNGLVAYYPFNGNANDESGNGYNGTPYNVALTNDRFGNAAKAYKWPSSNGGESYIGIGNIHEKIPTSISISAWIYMDGGYIGPRVISSGEIAVATDNSSNSPRSFYFSYDRAGAGIWPSSYQVPTLSWHHIVMIADAQMRLGKFYVDGVLRDQQVGGTPNPNVNMVPWNIGRKSTSAFDCWGGMLDDIRIYNRALTQEEITYLANN
jgi:hypothetical protein